MCADDRRLAGKYSRIVGATCGTTSLSIYSSYLISTNPQEREEEYGDFVAIVFAWGEIQLAVEHAVMKG